MFFILFGNNSNKWHLPTIVGVGLALVSVVFLTVNAGSWLENVVSSFAIAATLNVNVDSLFVKTDTLKC